MDQELRVVDNADLTPRMAVFLSMSAISYITIQYVTDCDSGKSTQWTYFILVSSFLTLPLSFFVFMSLLNSNHA